MPLSISSGVRPVLRSLASSRLALLASLMMVLLAAGATRPVSAQSEPTVPQSQRVTINLSAGMPGQSPWLYIKDQDDTSATAPSFAQTTYNDSGWQAVGIPYSANLYNSFLNADSGGGDGDLNGTTNWYRLHFKLASQYAGGKVLVEFEGAHTGAQVFINNTLLPGISAVTANANASHVIGFVPFIVDLTPYVHADGATDNVLAVRVSRGAAWFANPMFSQDYRFGQADAGLFRPAKMFLTSKVHIPENIYSNQKTWGTYVSTVSEVANPNDTTTAQSAVIRVQTNVLNETTSAQNVTLTTQIVDRSGNVVAAGAPVTQSIPAMTPSTYPSGATPLFDQQITVSNPTLWYPNNSTFGTPYMYRVYSIVSVNGQVVDSVQSPLGIRTITWDSNFPYFNGHPMYLWGGSGRYDYPALGSSVPEEQQWRDLAQMAAMGGNIWRPGHSTTSEEFVNAADAYGVMIDQPSGDGEGAFSNATADMITLKEELHRDMIIRDRSHPSILDWEANNGTMAETVGAALQQIANTWDPINTRAEADRTPDPKNGLILGCTLEGCEVGQKEQSAYANNPNWGAEYWGKGTGRGLAYDAEIAFAGQFLHNWTNSFQAKAFGMAQWYFADTPGEDSLFEEYQQYANTAQGVAYQSSVRSLGASMVDQNRFPKLLYYAYEAAWTPFSIKPVVKLAHHWNRAYQASAPITVNAFSNCPKVRLLVNGASQGDHIPNPASSDPGSDPPQTTTAVAFQATWTVNWVSGSVEADCIDELGNVVQYQNAAVKDVITTAGAPARINLTVVPELVRPDGSTFQVTANGSDAAFVVAQVVDANNVVVPTANNNITFSVSGPATYMGGTEQYVESGSDAYSTSAKLGSLAYHAPGDPELQAEGGLTKIALRSQFTAGQVTVTATSPGLTSTPVSFNVVAVPSPIPPASGPAIVVPPQSTSVTAGQTATFSATATGTAPLAFQWYLNGNAISGATGASYITPATATSQSGSNYTVKVSNSINAVTSAAAVLTVDAPASPAITTQPQAASVYVGQTATFSVAATGSPTLSYQWYVNNGAIAGATSPSYTTPVLTSTGGTGSSYTVVVTNPVSSLTSAPATLTINPAVAPTIVNNPISQQVIVNNPVTFNVVASGSSPFTYQWQKNGANIAGATGSSFTIAAVQKSDAGSYTVIVTNAAASVPSAVATLSIAPPGINLALGQPATASSVSNPSTEAAALAVDGDLNTRWQAQPGDPQWLQVDLGSQVKFNTVVLVWEAAYSTQYEIDYLNPSGAWVPAATNTTGGGGTETLSFAPVTARYVRVSSTQENNAAYGPSLYEFQVYNVASCTPPAGNRYTVNASNPNLVLDTISQLTWQRVENTYPGTGQQYTQSVAESYCSSQSMRLPTKPEALAISGYGAAVCAFPNPWETWTSDTDPNNAADAALVQSSGASSYQVANNFPGGVLCVSGTSVPPPTITQQPVATTATTGQPATFTVAASGTGPLSYQWYENGSPITAAINPSYTTLPATSADNGSMFSVVVTGPTNETATSNTVALTTVAPPPDVFSAASGSSAAIGSFSADAGFTAGGTYSNTNAVVTKYTANAAPQGVYQNERSGTFSYIVQGLTPSTQYSGRLHFAEIYFTQENQRVFNVNIQGQPFLTNFDIVKLAGGPNIALVEPFTATSDKNGNIQIDFFNGPMNAPKVSGVEIVGTGASGTGSGGGGGSTPTDVATIDAGSTVAVNAYVADTGFSGGSTYAPGQTVSNAGVAGAAPAAVYATARQGAFSYTIPGLTKGGVYTVNLHFAELYFPAAQKRKFNVSINNASVLADFDIFAAAGNKQYQAVVESFPNITADPTTGNIVITFSRGSLDQPMVNAIEVLTGSSSSSASTPAITTQPANQTATIGSTATFSVAATGSSLGYQWSKNGTPISGATGTSYTTPGTTAADNAAVFGVTVTNTSNNTSLASSNATLTVNTSPAYTTKSGAITVALNNNTNGAWPNSKIYVEVLGCNPANSSFSWVNYDGTVHAASTADNSAANSITGPDGKKYPNYSFTLGQSTTLVLPPLLASRIFISMGNPLYMTTIVNSGATGCNALGYTGPNPLNNTDPNINTHYDWYELTYNSSAYTTNPGIYINTTQVNQFGLPLLLDVWGSVNGVSEQYHKQVGINETIAAIDQEFANETPTIFQQTPISSLRIFAPNISPSFAAGAANGNYFDTYINGVWSYYTTNTLTIMDSGREFTGNAQTTQFLFTEVNLNNGAYQGGTYAIQKPTTQEILACNGSMASGNPTQERLEVLFCAGFNRGVMESYSNWLVPSAYYQQTPSNFYSQFWHKHSVGGLAYGYPFDDYNDQSTTIQTNTPEHMAFGIGW